MRKLLGATTLLALLLTATPAQAADATLDQEIAIPTYFYPGGDSLAYWNQLTTASSKPSIAVANVLNGPTNRKNDDYASVLATTHSAGVKVIGYVDTGYFGTTGLKTRLGSTAAADWRAQIQTDIGRWYEFYGSNIDGIFFDQAQKDCGPTTGSETWVNLYRESSAYVKKYHPGAITIHNPGIAPAACYADSADILVTFEGDYATYLNPPAERQQAAWEAAYDPKRIWHLVYDAPDATAVAAAVAKSKANNAGYIYVTNDVMANPWDVLPSTSYMSAQLAAAKGSGGATPATPAQPTASLVKATGLRLSWTSAAYPGVVGYDVYQGTTKIGNVANSTPSATTFDVGGLSPSTAYTFTVRARDKAGHVSAASTARSVTTAATSATAPTTPGTPTTSDLGPTSVKLAWAASTDADSGDGIAYYDVFQNGVRVQSLPGTVTAAQISGLSGGGTYAFTVKARDTTDRSSAASGQVSVTTPNPPPITDPATTLDSATATYTAQFNLPFSFHHVFIDTDANYLTGWSVQTIGAEFMIEDGILYKKTGDQTAFSWTVVSGVSPLLSTSGGLYRWSVPASALTGAGATHKVVFNGTGDSDSAYSDVITVTRG
ncbi:spherulation-specific family 4 protein [Nonomuraea sp. NEAU-A123]|uniref:spherulation-specific family 4 protein n=1 Tax=Nonomuraea sp. NEAU-A123 TaxID=2839649 RepID=UPI001BE46C4E|nr:spherulation-specific family 4 protein [Nonomuraea sp. NEAU-A123]MBT2234521.1 fibronectin type III domain-containing protein [Nonomuraea sp. NEAU-A123]